MTAAWVASAVRARAMSRRRLGRAATAALARRTSLDLALDELTATPYGHDVKPGQSLAEAQHAVAATTLWHLRVLAGWVPRGDAQFLRVLAGGFEIANVDEILRSFAGRTTEPPFRLGSLATAWPYLRSVSTVAELREALGRSAWGDPGSDVPSTIRISLRLTWALRVALTIPDARAWAAGAAALTVAREVLDGGRHLTPSQLRTAVPLLGTAWHDARTYAELRATLPLDARWTLAGVDSAAQMWRSEEAWWDRVASDGSALLHRPLAGPAPLIGAAAVLAADAWHVRAALELAARGGVDALRGEVGDAVA